MHDNFKLPMILHFLTDDKFADYTINQYSIPEGNSEFVLINTAGHVEWVKNRDKCRCVILPFSEEFREIVDKLEHYTGIVLHGIQWGAWDEYILTHVPSSVKVAWVLWGGEVYARKDNYKRYIAPLSRMLNSIHDFKKGTKDNFSWQIPFELFQRADYLLSDEREEFENARKYTGNNHMKFIWCAYFSIEDTIGELKDYRAQGNNIWLGNSATINVNYFENLPKIWFYGLKNRKLIVSLAYGSPWVRNLTMRLGKLFFGNKMQPLTSYMPLQEYNKLMLSCTTMIQPHYEPQAQGNIITALWLGMRVYMSEKSISYAFYKRIGALVFSWESEFKKYRYTLLTDVEIDHNRVVLNKWFGKEHIQQGVLDVVKALS